MCVLPELLRTFLLAWNRHDVEGVVAHYREDAEMIDPTLSASIVGKDALRRYYASMWDELPDARLECRCAEAARDGVAWAWRFSGASEHAPWQVVGASYFFVVDELIGADHAVWDPSLAR